MEELANQPGFKYTVSQFTVLKQIGSGAFGNVLLCVHNLTGQKVVLKAIDKRHIAKEKHLQVRFLFVYYVYMMWHHHLLCIRVGLT